MVLCWLFYFLFLESGLVHLLPSFLCSYFLPSTILSASSSPLLTTLLAIPCLSWKYAVYSLCLGHIFHSISAYRLFGALIILIFSVLIITLTEELSLRYGLFFGRYAFTSTFGARLTDNFPILALACWMCLIYPNLLLTNLIMTGSPYQLPKLTHILPSAILGATLLTYFDIISEPIHALYGHKLWHHAAFIDPITPLATYTPQPDWIFEPNQLFQDLYFGIPFQNFLGWFLTSFFVYFFIYFAFSLKQQQPSQQPSSFSHSPAYLASIFPIKAALLCVQIYLCLHPSHPSLVRILAGVYVVVVGCILVLRKTGNKLESENPKKLL